MTHRATRKERLATIIRHRNVAASAASPAPALVITSPSGLPSGIQLLPFVYQFTATVNGPYSDSSKPPVWSHVGGTLPAGTTVDDSGLLTGIPSDSAAYAFRMSAQAYPLFNDIAVAPVEKDFAISVGATVAGDPVDIVGTALPPGGVVGQPWAYQFIAYGGIAAIEWTKTVGSFPTGLVFQSSGALIGTPTASGTFTFTLSATDASTSDTQAYSITVVEASLPTDPSGTITVTTISPLPQGQQGLSYTPVQLQADGNTGAVTWSVGAGMPDGLSLSANGWIAGIPGDYGTFTFTVTAAHTGDTSGTKLMTLVIKPPLPVLTFTSPATGSTYVAGTALSIAWSIAPYPTDETPVFQLFAFKQSTLSGQLPLVITDNLNGTYSASLTIPASAAADPQYSIGVLETVTGANAMTGLFAITAYPPIVISTSGALGSVPKDVLITPVQFAATGGTATITWTSTTLPTGLSLSSGGLLTGTPTVAGGNSFTVRATDGIGPVTTLACTLSVTVAATIVITTASPLPNATISVALSPITLTQTGGTSPTWSISAGALPTGVSLSSGGVLTGTPTVAAVYSFTVSAAEAAHTTGTKAFTWTVIGAALTPGTAQLTLLDGTTIIIPQGADVDIVNGSTNASLAASGVTVSQTINFANGSTNAPGTSNPGIHVRMTARELEIRNKGKPDAMGTGVLGEGNPVYFTALSANMPGRVVYFGDYLGVVQNGSTFDLITPTMAKHPTRTASSSVVGGIYSGSRANHMMDGGDRIHYIFAPATDAQESALFPSAQNRTDAASLVNVNETRVTAYPFMEHILNLYRHDSTTFDNTALPLAQTRMTWLARVENVAAITSGGTPDNIPEAFKTWHMGGFLFAPIDGKYQRPILYSGEMWFGIRYLRNTSDTDSYVWGLHFMRRKIASALRSSDTAGAKYKGGWGDETTGSLNAAGGFPQQINRMGQGGADYLAPWWKAWSEGLAFYRVLTGGNDPLVNDAFDRNIAHILGQTLAWTSNTGTSPASNGNMRCAAHVLMDAWMLFKACIILGGSYTATAALLKAKAEAYIETMFVAQDQAFTLSGNTVRPYWPPATTNPTQTPMNSGGGWANGTGAPAGTTGPVIRALEHWQIAFTKWMADSGTVDGTGTNTNPTRLAHWKLMMNWWFTYNSVPSAIQSTSGGVMRFFTYSTAPNITSPATWNGIPSVVFLNQDRIVVDAGNPSAPPNGMFGAWVLCMQSYMESWYPGGVTPSYRNWNNSGATVNESNITWAVYFAQLARGCYEWQDSANHAITVASTGVATTGHGQFSASSWGGKITGQLNYGSCDF